MKFIKFKTKKDVVYINPLSITYVQRKNNKEDITQIGFNSGNSMYVNYIEAYEPIDVVLRKLEEEY